MAIEQTLSIIKPDAVQKNSIGGIISKFEEKGLRVVAAQMKHLSKEEAEGFYAVHKARPFFPDLIRFMTEGPVLLMVLEGENAIARNREIMGATNPEKADAGTLRKLFGTNIERNAVHGSDAPDTAKFEIGWFFPQRQVYAGRK
ncbi:MAG: nucleoside-diphosphate kinase [Deltaproteobacteria bacterium]|nr:nucleoside-diphosphate kinase [Deltaproteobacteria bacterium]